MQIKPSSENRWIYLSLIALIYPLSFWMTRFFFWRRHQTYGPEIQKEYDQAFPIFSNGYLSAELSALLLIIAIIFSSIAVSRIENRKAYFIALPLAIISSVLFLFTLFSLM